MKKTLISLLLLLSVGLHAQAQLKYKPHKKKDYVVTISTRLGDIKMILFDDALQHKKNFLKLASQHFYDSTSFHRVLDGFMIQGGDPNTKPSNDSTRIGMGGPGYELNAELNTPYKHERGMVAAARQNDSVNPNKKSSGSQFYIVQANEGAHHLDGAYTIFGQVISGMEVVDVIAAEDVDRSARPLEPIRMSVSLERMKKKDITKEFGYEYKGK
ncbi:peptidylprolyl isomerase [Limibacter armeniacum]|uniref:peptidylprolyl isomerase n=1 Tax=Limibacter armeniacum TaxID=466084 RepID=UPI002FE56CDC